MNANRSNIVSIIATLLLAAGTLSGAEIELGALNLRLMKAGWGTPQANKDVAGGAMKMSGRVYTEGVGTHAPSLGVIRLGRAGVRFQAKVGVTDGMPEGGSVEFIVSGDGKLLFDSGIIRGGQPPLAVDVSLGGVRTLKLEVTDGGDGMNSDHANWAEAELTYSGQAPEMIDQNTNPPDLYPLPEKLIPSPGNATYFVDPANGDNMRSGRTRDQAWHSIAKINSLKLAAGDKVVIAPGLHEESLKPSGEGTAANPIVIQFLPGIHTFAVDDAIRLPMFVSNSSDAPLTPKPIGILVQNAKHLRIEGGGVDGPGKTEILYGGRMVEIFNDHSQDITYTGLAFDLRRPPVSEFRVMETASSNVLIKVAEGSTYRIDKGQFAWTGDLGPGWTMTQQADPVARTCGRMGQWNPFSSATAEDLGGGEVRLTYKTGNLGIVKGRQFQFRNTQRDSVGVHNNRCKDITIRDCDFYMLTNMGIVSQFTENITYLRVNVAPPAGMIRTCAAWGDVFHFSNCKGDILVDSCHISGTQDDPMNCHGTHLRIIERTGDNQLLVRFMQPQTYGIPAYAPGDEVAVINHANLREYPDNPRLAVTKLERRTDKDWLVTFAGAIPKFGTDDVLDNITWYPNLTFRNNYIDMDSTRGILVTTRGKVLIEGNTFMRCAMAGLLVEDDAEGWFESGPIRDMTIRGNRFIGCGIEINPHTASSNAAEPVHENIRIEDNLFSNSGVTARNVKGLTVTGNRSSSASLSVQTGACTDVKIEGNTGNAKE